MRHTFRKHERLNNKKLINRLLTEGEVFFSYPLRVVSLYHDISTAPPLQVIFFVGKRHFKKAVQRNRIRRRMKEAWRLSKHLYVSSGNKPLVVALQYAVAQEENYVIIEEKIKQIILRLSKQNDKNPD